MNAPAFLPGVVTSTAAIVESAGVVPGVSKRALSSGRSETARADHAPSPASRHGFGNFPRVTTPVARLNPDLWPSAMWEEMEEIRKGEGL